jgi:hypothetical protein
VIKIILFSAIRYVFQASQSASLHTILLVMRTRKIIKEKNTTILAITDLSEKATNAIVHAVNLFKEAHIKLILLNVLENRKENTSLLISVEDVIHKGSDIALEKQSAEITSIFKKKKLDISTCSLLGRRLNIAIGNNIHYEDIDLIVTGISPAKNTFKEVANIPLLFIGQSRFPVLLVSENCSHKAVKNILTINLSSYPYKNTFSKTFEHIIKDKSISKHTIHIYGKKINNVMSAILHTMLTKHKINLIVIISSPGDKIDRALLGYNFHDLYPAITSLLVPQAKTAISLQ